MLRHHPALIAASALLAGCATTSAPPAGGPPVSQTPTPASSCDASRAQFVVGRSYTAQAAEQARTAAGAILVRKLEPGRAYTQEFLEGRLNLQVDAADVVTAARCG